MASQMVVPASKDTLFMRGFSARQNIDTLRDFFTENGGPCTVEFFKESEDKNKLYVALRFDTKDVAKEVLNRYDNKEVLNDRITISWFKDLRRARAKENQGRRSYSGGWTERSPENYYGGRQQGQYGQYGRNRQFSGGREYGGRNRRDRSTSHSRSRSRSYSRDRSGSRSPAVEKRNRSRSPSADSHGPRRRSVSASEESPVKDPTPQRSRRGPSPDRMLPRHDSSPGEGARAVPEDGRSLDRASLSHRSHSPAPLKGKPLRSAISSVPRAEVRTEEPPSEPDSRFQERDFERRRPQYEDGYYEDRRQEPPVKEESRKVKPDHHSGDDYYYDNNYDSKNFKRSYSPEQRHERGRGRGEEARPGVADYPASPPVLKEEPPLRKERQPEDYGYRSDEVRGPEVRGRGAPPFQEPRDWVQPPQSPGHQDSAPPPRRKRGYEEPYEPDFETDMKRTKRYPDDLEPPRGSAREPYEERPSRGEKTRPGGRAPPRGERERSPFDDHQSISSSQRGANFNGNMTKETERGALGLPHEKMIMVREKKEEIEKSYRQDCETFAAVTKMLISKDAELEDRLQHSLRDNLQDIGQRCIHELREFIDKLKTEEGI